MLEKRPIEFPVGRHIAGPLPGRMAISIMGISGSSFLRVGDNLPAGPGKH